MRTTFPIRVLGGTSIPEGTDNPVTIPPTLQPVTQFPSQLQTVSFNAVAAQSQTFLASVFVDRAASSAAFGPFVLATLNAGLWEVELAIDCTGDFNQPGIAGLPLQMSLTSPGAGGATSIILTSGVFIALTRVTRTMLLNLSLDGWNVNYQGPATAAAQTYHPVFTIYGKRLA